MTFVIESPCCQARFFSNDSVCRLRGIKVREYATLVLTQQPDSAFVGTMASWLNLAEDLVVHGVVQVEDKGTVCFVMTGTTGIFSGGTFIARNESTIIIDPGHCAVRSNSLAVESQTRETTLEFPGEKYEWDDFQIIGVAYPVNLDLTSGAEIGLAGDMTGSGTIRWIGQGTEKLVFRGNQNQKMDVSFKHGDHMINRIINAKSGGQLTLLQPVTVWRYLDAEGNPLLPLDKMRILSNVELRFALMLAGDRQKEVLNNNGGTKLDEGIVACNGGAVFFGKISDASGNPVDAMLLESIVVKILKMNPVAPNLHPPRRVVVSERRIPIAEVVSKTWQQILTSQGVSEYNFRYASDETGDLKFPTPGLYYVIFKVKMFGKHTPVPLRFALKCEG